MDYVCKYSYEDTIVFFGDKIVRKYVLKWEKMNIYIIKND